ncbi:MAG: ABC transporter ATP-binding protein [Nocardioides sp.]
MTRETPVELRGLGKSFGSTTALEGVDLSLGPGEVLGYLGPNGAGKTTTIRLLMGLLRPTAGDARVFGHDAWRDAVQVHRRTGYVPGDPSLYRKLTGRQHVAYLSALRGLDVVKRADELAERLALDLDRPAGHLSRGNRQKLAIVLAWMATPDLLVLDEPTSGLDPLVQQEFHALVREHTATGGTVLLSSHVLGEVQRVADRIGVLRTGRLVAVESLAVLAAKSLHRVRATVDDALLAGELEGIPGVRDLQVQGAELTCSAPQAALDAVLKRVAAHQVVDFECAEAELEETFLAYYGEVAR